MPDHHLLYLADAFPNRIDLVRKLKLVFGRMIIRSRNLPWRWPSTLRRWFEPPGRH